MSSSGRNIKTPEERRAECESFIDDPDKFGRDTWVTINVFAENVRNVETAMIIQNHLLIKLNNEEEFLSKLTGQQVKLPDQEMLRIMQLIVLDHILKACMIAESSLVFIYELAGGYRGLSTRMARYSLNDVTDVISKAIWENDLDFKLLRAMGVPTISNMPLEQHETVLLQDLYRQTEDRAIAALQRIATFYNRFKRVYNKYRHGLIVRTGATPDNDSGGNSRRGSEIEGSFIDVFDFYKKEHELPRDSIPVYRDIDNSLPGLFNALSHVRVGQELLHEIFDIVSIAKQIISYTCSNHKIYALNCGEPYLPLTMIDGQPNLTFMVPEEVYRANEEVLKIAADKVVRVMNLQGGMAGECFTFRNEKVVQAMQNYTLTNIHIIPPPP